MRRSINLGLSLTLVSIVAIPATAQITGSFAGTSFATVSLTNINFCPNGLTPNGPNLVNACIPGSGNIDLAAGSGSFAGVSGNLNLIQSLNQVLEPTGTMVAIPNWMVFNPPVSAGHGPISLVLTEVLPGSFSAGQCGQAAAAGQICTPAGSAFNFTNQTANSSTACFEIAGYAVDKKTGNKTPLVAIFTSQFTISYQAVLAAIAANGGAGNYSSSYSVAVAMVHPLVDGRMTGGGWFPVGSNTVTHGFELHCDTSDRPNNLEVNWNGNHFHLDALTSASCLYEDGPPAPPVAPITTLTGAGTGSYNNVPGAFARFVLTDHGEPGRKDTVKISIVDANGNVVLSAGPVLLGGGNQQAHFDNK